MRNAEARYCALVGNSSDLVLEFDSAGRLLSLSPNCSPLVSRPLEEVLGKTLEESGILDSLHPEDRRPLFETFREGIESREETTSRFRLRFPDDSWHSFEAVSTPVEQVDGSPRVLSICRDVTDAE